MSALTGHRADGGPAFPREDYQANGAPEAQPLVLGQEGMSLRDYFAAKAMHQFLAGARLPVGYEASADFEMTATRAYEVADAMLAARVTTKGDAS